MRKYDFILVYEHKARELETLCLLKCELEKRQYSVCILGLNSFEFYKSHNAICKFKYYAEVLIVFGCYSTNTLRMCVQQIVKFDKVINMQWEQMLSVKDEQIGGAQDFLDIGKEVAHISWGSANRNRLVNNFQIAAQKVFECGNVAFDFLTPQFEQYYCNKEEICQRFVIPESMKICTIFANFKYASFSDEYIAAQGKLWGEEWIQTQYVAKRAKTMVLNWIKNASQECKDIFFVYRPHPSEDLEVESDFFEGLDNVRVIGDLSSKQWIKISDIMFTWHSTVAIEAKAAKKTCILVEPEGCEVPELEEARIFHGAKGVKNYEEFCKCLKGEVVESTISEQLIEEYFGKVDLPQKYLKVVDAFEKIYFDDYYLLNEEIKKYGVYSLSADARSRVGINWIVDELVWIYLWFVSILGGGKKDKRIQEYLFIREREKQQCASSKEIRVITKKIREILGYS